MACFNDRSDPSQQAWIDQIMAGNIKSTVSENYIAGVSSAQRNYDVLIVCGNDPRRINKLVRLYRPILGDKVKIAIMVKSSPADRVQLLNGGLDDVFDFRTSLVEARVRIMAHVRRYHGRKIAVTGQLLGGEGDGFDRLFKARPTPAETGVFQRLIAAVERPVSIPDLCSRTPVADNALNRRSLQVFICRIRKKLIPGVSIQFCGDAGYLLHLNHRGIQI